MRLKLNTKIILGFGIALTMLLATSLTAYYSIQKLAFYTRMVEHTYETLRASSQISQHTRDGQMYVRSYLLLNDTTYQSMYQRSVRDGQLAAAQLERLTADNGPQQLRLDTLNRLVREERQLLGTWLQRPPSPTAARDLVQADRGRIEVLRRLIGRITREETMLLQQRNQGQAFYASVAPIAIVVSAILAIIIVLWLFFKISRELTANEQLQQELTLTNQDTARRIEIVEHLAAQVLDGDYTVKIKDKEKDSLGNLANLLNRMTQRLDESFGALENRNKELDQFAYVASHDLKAPLRGVTTIVKWIEDELATELSPQMHQYLDMMKGRLARLEDLINGLLAYARIGRTEQKTEEVDVRQLVSEVTDLVVPPDFKVELPDSLPTFFTDRLSLQQVFTNLFSNAVKYHHRGAGTITVRCQENRKDYEFTVADDGPGIAPAYHEKIFLMFQTLRDRNTAESTGIGLSIVKKIIDEQKGTMRVSSAEGQGAAFIFTWPKQPVTGKMA
ncbi:sensor histidine kinase [Hymenobacter persicinus]|uniref:histidine kinase n=1 Tax=Hymenobacter persicinus TaxID=2025506 RepID=A0A4Q5LDH5_9BACT|nr:ATP-binding protein [Hymenobacter persicinus]RYU81611.1 hypothetical protein EWM57_06345 [Hymenobacter persicinus]